MHPELLNNSLFLRYYRQWQEDPASIVFAPIAEYFLLYGMVNEAEAICREGLGKHPQLVSGHVAMAKVHLARERWDDAEALLRQAMAIAPQHPRAQQLLADLAARRRAPRGAAQSVPTLAAVLPEGDAADAMHDAAWDTITMAGIFAAQGHHDKAREIYRSILARDPDNEAAKRGIERLPPPQ
jgi:tetratricopeptide (TPR) repeat protein